LFIAVVCDILLSFLSQCRACCETNVCFTVILTQIDRVYTFDINCCNGTFRTKRDMQVVGVPGKFRNSYMDEYCFMFSK